MYGGSFGCRESQGTGLVLSPGAVALFQGKIMKNFSDLTPPFLPDFFPTFYVHKTYHVKIKQYSTLLYQDSHHKYNKVDPECLVEYPSC